MLFPLTGIPVVEYDATFTISPTSRVDHHSDTVLASVEMLVRNDSGERITFPFMVLSTDPGTNAREGASVEPKVYNGSDPVEITADEVDEDAAAEAAVQRVAAGGGDAQAQQEARDFVRKALASAERRRVGRTTLEPNQSRRIVLQQRLRILPDPDGAYVFRTIAPSPLMTTTVGGRVSVYVLLPFEDPDVSVTVLEDDSRTERGFSYERTQVKQREIVSWFWQNDPLLRLAYRYA